MRNKARYPASVLTAPAAWWEPLRLVLMAFLYAVVVLFAFLISKHAYAAPTENCRDAAAQCALPSVPGAYTVEVIVLDFVFDDVTWQIVSFTPRWSPVGLRAAGEVIDCASWGPFDAAGDFAPGSYGVWSGSQCRYELTYPSPPDPGASAPAASASGALATEATASDLRTIGWALALGVQVCLFALGFSTGKGFF